MDLATTILTTIGTLVTYLIGKNFFIPQLAKLWEWIKKKNKENVNATRELIEIKQENHELYVQQIQFLNSQVSELENELLNYIDQLEKLRTKVLELNKKLFEKGLLIAKVHDFICINKQCKARTYCQNVEELIKTTNENDDTTF